MAKCLLGMYKDASELVLPHRMAGSCGGRSFALPVSARFSLYNSYTAVIYRSLAKKGPWADHLTSLPKRGVGALSGVSAFNHERAPMSCLQRLDALEANNWTNSNVQRNHQRLRSRVLTAHNTLKGTTSL